MSLASFAAFATVLLLAVLNFVDLGIFHGQGTANLVGYQCHEDLRRGPAPRSLQDNSIMELALGANNSAVHSGLLELLAEQLALRLKRVSRARYDEGLGELLGGLVGDETWIGLFGGAVPLVGDVDFDNPPDKWQGEQWPVEEAELARRLLAR